MFKKGDIVIVDPNSDFSIYPRLDNWGRVEDSEMFHYMGKPLAITDFVNYNGTMLVRLEGSKWAWNTLWFKKIGITEGVLTEEELERINKLNHV